MRDRRMIDATNLFVTTPKFKKLFKIDPFKTLRHTIYQNKEENFNLPYEDLLF